MKAKVCMMTTAALFIMAASHAQLGLGATTSATVRAVTNVNTGGIQNALRTVNTHVSAASQKAMTTAQSLTAKTTGIIDKTTGSVKEISNSNQANAALDIAVQGSAATNAVDLNSEAAVSAAAGSNGAVTVDGSLQGDASEGISDAVVEKAQQSKELVIEKAKAVKEKATATAKAVKEKAANTNATVSSSTEVKSDTQVKAGKKE